MTLGLGHDALVRVPVDAEYPHAPRVPAGGDHARPGRAAATPLAVVATVGTTSTTSVDPVVPVARLCREEGIWLHVDAA